MSHFFFNFKCTKGKEDNQDSQRLAVDGLI